MRRLLFVILLLCPASAWAQVSAPTTIEVRDEGSTQGRVRALNCSGAGISCSVTSGLGTLSVSGGGSGSANVVEVSISLGTGGGMVYAVTVTGQSWVGTTSQIVCSPFATTADGQTVETYAAAMLTITAATRVAGTGFDLWVANPHGATGTFRFHCTGA